MPSDPYDRVLRAYLRAKDEQRPHAMKTAFSPEASFVSHFLFETDFADETPKEGLQAITDTFRRLGQFCENIYTLCTPESVEETDGAMACKWVVTMTERHSGNVRVAWGDYIWHLDDDGILASHLKVTMVKMVVLPPETAPPILDWISGLPHPWCPSEVLTGTAPDTAALQDMTAYLR